MNKYSQQVWADAASVVEKIKRMTFIQELKVGILPENIFRRYLIQDKYYLNDYFDCFTMLCHQLPKQHKACVLGFATNTLAAEESMVTDHYGQSISIPSHDELTIATANYTNFLRNICATKPVEIGFAGILPCFWVYQEIGTYCRQAVSESNPYAEWINLYAGEVFQTATQQAIAIFDDLASHTSHEIRQQMQIAFIDAIWHEWHFWQDAYDNKLFVQQSL